LSAIENNQIKKNELPQYCTAGLFYSEGLREKPEGGMEISGSKRPISKLPADEAAGSLFVKHIFL
jgi:hypothetical protein